MRNCELVHLQPGLRHCIAKCHVFLPKPGRSRISVMCLAMCFMFVMYRRLELREQGSNISVAFPYIAASPKSTNSYVL